MSLARHHGHGRLRNVATEEFSIARWTGPVVRTLPDLHGDPNLAALDLACLVALLGELAHDLEAHGIGERLEHGDAADGVEIGGGKTHWLTMIV